MSKNFSWHNLKKLFKKNVTVVLLRLIKIIGIRNANG